MTLIMFDIDLFKRVNDTHGHATGDEVLRAVASRCAASLRRHDLVGRVGGEEFCVMLPETTEAAAMVVAEELRKAVAADGIDTTHGQVITVTASFGVASLGHEDRTFETLLTRADSALYAAKEAGRNCVHAYAVQQPREQGMFSTSVSPGKPICPLCVWCTLTHSAVCKKCSMISWPYSSRS